MNLYFAPDDFHERTWYMPTRTLCRVCHHHLDLRCLTLTAAAIERLFEPYRRYTADPNTKLPTDILVCGRPLYLCSQECLAILCLNPDLVLA